MKKWMIQLKATALMPVKRAVFTLNRMSIGDALWQLTAITMLVTIVYGVFFLGASAGELANMPFGLAVVYFLTIYFALFFFSVLMFGFAGGAYALLIATLFKRKLVYRVLLKLSFFVLTLPLAGYGVFLVLHEPLLPAWTGISAVYVLAVLTRTVLQFPARRGADA
ncbi:hypothetical protein [Alkalicoccus chagannorensis]|uniref:hypothetical protein n=1 Tax=Alkalicoccus chagannorensis TaxID=427072 RepID=UPI000415FB01|nr:hypothetical protein [Alkalicoccus chagannorensis]